MKAIYLSSFTKELGYAIGRGFWDEIQTILIRSWAGTFTIQNSLKKSLEKCWQLTGE